MPNDSLINYRLIKPGKKKKFNGVINKGPKIAEDEGAACQGGL